MSWFHTSNFANIAKSALKEAQKTIDKALDIRDSVEEAESVHEYENISFCDHMQPSHEINEHILQEKCEQNLECNLQKETEVIKVPFNILEEPYVYAVQQINGSDEIVEGNFKEKYEVFQKCPDHKGEFGTNNEVLIVLEKLLEVISVHEDYHHRENTENSLDASAPYSHFIDHQPVQCEPEMCSHNLAPVITLEFSSKEHNALPSFNESLTNCKVINNKLATENYTEAPVKLKRSDTSTEQLNMMPYLANEGEKTQTKPVSLNENWKKKDLASILPLLSEKDRIIRELKEEGEKLSKQQLHQQTLIKKLRTKEKENEKCLFDLREQLEQSVLKFKSMQQLLLSKEEKEKNLHDTVEKLTELLQEQQQESDILRKKLKEAENNIETLQKTLDVSNKNLANMQQSLVLVQDNCEKKVLNADTACKQQLQKYMEEQQDIFRQKENALMQQLENFQNLQVQFHASASSREEGLKQHISELQKQLQQSELKNEELSRNLITATQPLLQQIEALQASFGLQQQTWEQSESYLREQAYKTQKQLALTEEHLKSSTEKIRTLTDQITKSQKDLARQQEANAFLTKQLQVESKKQLSLEEVNTSILDKLRQENEVLHKELSQLKKRHYSLQTQLERSFRKDAFMMKEQQDDEQKKEHKHSNSLVFASPTSNQKSLQICQENPLGSWQNGSLEFVISNPGLSFPTCESPSLENLVNQVKQQHGQITQLQFEVKRLENLRKSLEHEILDLTKIDHSHAETGTMLENLQKQFTELQQQQLYGEKLEESEELKLDLIDFKEMYKSQLNDLLQREQSQ